jgi:hypothetical protein
MSDAIHFSTLPRNEPDRPTCPLCTAHLVEFEFHFNSESRPLEQLRGRCCFSCATALLDAMLVLTTADEDQLLSSGRTLRCISKYVN